MKLNRKVLKAAEFKDLVWVNHEPLTLSKLRGRIVLVNFWDYTFHACLRTITYLKVWHGRYKDKGLVVIGVHAPEFPFGHKKENVTRAIEDLGIDYPVAMDNKFTLWRAFSNHYWPSEYLIDSEGYLADYHLGGGGFQNFEISIQELLRELDPHIVLPRPIEPLNPEDRDDVQLKSVTPDIYFGFRRGRIGNEEGFVPYEVVDYKRPARIAKDMYHAVGRWRNLPDALEAAGEGIAEIVLSYEAQAVAVVVEPGTQGEQYFEVYQDGTPVKPWKEHEDVVLADGKSIVRVDYPRLYYIVKNPHSGPHILTFKTPSKGLRFYSINFIPEVIGPSV